MRFEINEEVCILKYIFPKLGVFINFKLRMSKYILVFGYFFLTCFMLYYNNVRAYSSYVGFTLAIFVLFYVFAIGKFKFKHINKISITFTDYCAVISYSNRYDTNTNKYYNENRIYKYDTIKDIAITQEGVFEVYGECFISRTTLNVNGDIIDSTYKSVIEKNYLTFIKSPIEMKQHYYGIKSMVNLIKR